MKNKALRIGLFLALLVLALGAMPSPEAHASGPFEELVRLPAPEGLSKEWFGYDVAISGDTAVVASYYGRAAYIYERNQGGTVYVFGTSAPPDADEDGIPDEEDNCPAIANADQADTDEDGVGDVCDPDDDNDGADDVDDNCPFTANPGQEDNDGDGAGDVCDPDDDNDGVDDEDDNCPFTANPGQEDNDGNGAGDVCDPDDDNDGVDDVDDNCPMTANPGQEDNDEDGAGDVCDDDDDNDGVLDEDDAFPYSNMDATVCIGDCDSGVDNQVLADGATFNDLIGEAAAEAKNHGDFVSAVSKLANQWKKDGLISGKEKGKITSCAARSDIP